MRGRKINGGIMGVSKSSVSSAHMDGTRADCQYTEIIQNLEIKTPILLTIKLNLMMVDVK